MIPLLAIDHQFELREFLSYRQNLLLVNLFVACEKRSTWLFFISIERVLSEAA